MSEVVVNDDGEVICVLFSVYDRFCTRHEGGFLKTHCPSCFRDMLLDITHTEDDDG